MLDFGRGGNELVETARLHGEELRKQRETVAETLAALMGKDPWSGRRVLALIDERIGELER